MPLESVCLLGSGGGVLGMQGSLPLLNSGYLVSNSYMAGKKFKWKYNAFGVCSGRASL